MVKSEHPVLEAGDRLEADVEAFEQGIKSKIPPVTNTVKEVAPSGYAVLEASDRVQAGVKKLKGRRESKEPSLLEKLAESRERTLRFRKPLSDPVELNQRPSRCIGTRKFTDLSI